MKRTRFLLFLISIIGMTLLIACNAAPAATPEPAAVEDPTAVPEPEPEAVPVSREPEVSMRESGLQMTVYNLGDVTIHVATAPEPVFANSTYIIESANNLVVIDTQFLLPNAMDFRAYADSLAKPIERVLITHEHPDHFLGSEAFADVPVFALAETSALIAEVGQAEIDEKQAQFGDAIASIFVTPEVLEPGTMEIDGVTYDVSLVKDAEAEFQLVTKLPDYDVAFVGDIVYSGVHLIMAGMPPTWIAALEDLKADSTADTIVLPGHGLPGDASLYDENIAWLSKAGELMSTTTTAEEFKGGLIEAFPDLGMDAAIDFVLPFLFPENEGDTSMGLIEVITVDMAEGATMDAFLPANQVIEDEYASQQPGYRARETAVSDAGQIRLVVHWDTKADSDASIAGFGEANGLDAFMSNFNGDTMAIKQYEVVSSIDGQTTYPNAGVAEVITVRLQDGADVVGWIAANDALREEHIVKQPGYLGRTLGVTEDGEWIIVVHWESVADAEASIAKFMEAPGIETFMSFPNMETMTNTLYTIQP